ncbi:type IV secretory system conjugative DNA transfer family protein [Christensenellaceae bacterium OttesenSCG-928-K19]|nr:type IV secretory system conjugative DNA transfer family protein [Christensenellaceae bacterium OttesenSCG-928-K19]
MRKISKKTIGLLLVIVLCFSMMPMSAMATAEGTTAPITEETPDNQGDAPADAPSDEAPKPSEAPTPAPSEAPEPSAGPEVTDSTVSYAAPIEVAPELVKVVDKPLIEVVYHYYDAAQNQNVGSFEEYTVASTHSYNALTMANGDTITIAANKYPAQVPVSTDALRFRVLLDGNVDITAQAAYDAAAGTVSLPHDFMGHSIAVLWYCPTSEITQLPVAVTVSTYQNGAFADTVTDLSLASDANMISVPLAEMSSLVVSQNGIDLAESAYSMSSGNLNISASALGGDIAITAYAPKAAARGITTMGTSATTVVHTRSADQIYYGYYTSYYTANGRTAFCLDPTVSGLNAGTYDVSGYLTRGTGYDDLIKAAYYLYGGPAYDSVKNNLFGDPDSMEAYGLCHAAVAYMWLDNPSAFMGLSGATRDHLLRVIDSVNAQAMPPEGFDVFLYNVGSGTNQSLISWDYTPTSNLEIVKVSSNPAFTDNNDCYSLEGAVFGVYNGSDEKIGSITTDKDGKGKLEGIAANQTGLYILEEKPPKGYAEHTEKIPFEIVAGQTTTVEVKNKPQGDPVTILLKKQDEALAEGKAQGGATLKGAQFTIKYYKGIYTESELKGKTPARKWIVETNANGFAMLHPDFVVAGSDPLYFASNGTTPTIPLGTVTVQETKAPTGYRINDEIFVRYSKTEGRREAVNTYNEPIIKEPPIRGGVEIEKWDYELNRRAVPQGDASLAGAVFDIYNRTGKDVVVGGKTYANNAVVYTMTTNATGAAKTANDLLPYGDYEIIEKTAPTGYLNTGVIKQKFKIESHGVIVNLKTNSTTIKNNVIRGGVEIEKWDIERDESTLKQGDAVLSGAVLEIWNRSKGVVVVGGKEYAPNTVVRYGQYMRGKEHGSAQFGGIKDIARRYKQDENIILSQNVCIGLDMYRHQHNLNIFCLGGSGSSKSRSFCIPSLLNGNTNFIASDPKGELLRSTGGALEKMGYDVKVLNLIDMENSHCYNPFTYLRKDEDVISMITCLIKNTTPKNAMQNDPFWEKAEMGLLQALMYYLWYEAPPYEQTLSMVADMLVYADVREDDETHEENKERGQA